MATETETTITVNHAQRAHAVHNPSSSKIWLDCGMYYHHKIKAEAAGEEYDKSGAAAERGTWLHELAERTLRLLLQEEAHGVLLPVAECLRSVLKEDEIKGFDPLPKADIEQVEIAVNSALALIDGLGPDATVLLEVDVPLRYEPGQTGSVDVAAFNTEKLIVIDYKFGRMPVQPDASQLLIYASELVDYLDREGYLDASKLLEVQTAITQPALHWEALVHDTSVIDLLGFSEEVQAIVEDQVLGGDRHPASELDTCEWCPFKNRCAGYVGLVSSIMTETLDVVETDEDVEMEIPSALVERIVRNRKAIQTLIADCTERVVEDEDSFPDWTRTRVNNPLRWNTELADEAEIAFQLRLNGVDDPYTLASPAKIRAQYKTIPDIDDVIYSHCVEQGFHIRLKPPKEEKLVPVEGKATTSQDVGVNQGSSRLKAQVEAAMKPAKKAAKKKAAKKKGRPAKR